MTALITVCAWCRRVKEGDLWLQSKTLAQLHAIADGQATHSICPECALQVEAEEARP